MADQIQQYRERLAAARQHLLDAIERVRDHGEEQVYSDGAQWTVRQLLIHLAVADRGHNNMLMAIASGKELIPEDYDRERFNRRSVEKRAEMTVDEALESLHRSREKLLKWLETIDNAVLEKRGRHANMRIMSIGEILDLMAHHERDHADDLLAAVN